MDGGRGVWAGKGGLAGGWLKGVWLVSNRTAPPTAIPSNTVLHAITNSHKPIEPRYSTTMLLTRNHASTRCATLRLSCTSLQTFCIFFLQPLTPDTSPCGVGLCFASPARSRLVS